MTQTFPVVKIKGNSREAVEDLVVEEVPLTLVLDGKELVTLLCCPQDLEDLSVGFLFTSGLIKKAEEIKKIVINQQQWIAYIDFAEGGKNTELVFKRLYTSGCGRGTLFYNTADIIHRVKIISDFKIEAAKVSGLMADFQKQSESYLKTGGAHSAALAGREGILIFREDIGRHNAIDKVIGSRLKVAGDFENKILITSGRISSEVLLKAQKCKIPIVVSKSAPTNQGIKLAVDMGITLVGFARGNRMNIYSQEERVI